MSNSKKVLHNRVILVIGAGKGLGSILARKLAEQGAILAINDLTPINLDQVESDIRSAGGKVKSYIVDASKKIPIQALVNSVQDDFGFIDILIHCARVQPSAPLLNLDDWEWQRTLDVNLTGAFLTMQSAARIMREKGRGMMILTDSSATHEPDPASYSISMAGLHELTKRARSEFEHYGIQVHWVDGLSDKTQLVKQIQTLCTEAFKEDTI